MRTKDWYLGLAVAGTALPYSQFLPFLHEHGLNPTLFLQQLFANRVSSFFALDVVVSSVALWVLVIVEGRRLRIRHLWVPLLSNLAVGVSLALPLFLYMRERRPDPARGSRQEA